MSYEILRKTQMTVFTDGVPAPRFVGVGRYTYGTGETVDCFGLACMGNDPQYLTHMRYGMDYFLPTEVLHHSRTIRDGWFEFCGGNGCCTIAVTADELERAFRELELIK